MSISSKPLCENLSALSRPSLPHLAPSSGGGEGGEGGRGAFASQYVAHHMQDIVGEPSGELLSSTILPTASNSL